MLSKEMGKMEIEKRLALLQYTYAASIAETVNTYEKLKVLNDIVEMRKERQAQSALSLNRQLGVETVEDVFSKLSEVYGCANWAVEKTDDGYVATATACKLCALSKKMGGANPCNGWCLDPMFTMITVIGKIDGGNITVESTLMDGDCCKVFIKEKQVHERKEEFINSCRPGLLNTEGVLLMCGQ
jgi:hypothetical protein